MDKEKRNLKIKTGVAKRMGKDVRMYETERAEIEAKIQKIKGENGDVHTIQHQINLLSETNATLGDTRVRALDALRDLYKVLKAYPADDDEAKDASASIVALSVIFTPAELQEQGIVVPGAEQKQQQQQAQAVVAVVSEEKKEYAAGSAVAGQSGTQRERTFIAIKPDGVQRNLIGRIIRRFEEKGFKLVAIKITKPTLQQANTHYIDLKGKKFYNDLCTYFSSGPILAMAWEGSGVIKAGRALLGATNPADSLPGTIRGDYCVDVGRNICHGSDGPESAKRELEFWFKPDDVCEYAQNAHSWLYE